jgi:hypothetical protein
MTISECGKRWQIIQQCINKRLTEKEIAEKLEITRSMLSVWMRTNGHLMMVMYGYLPFRCGMPRNYLKYTEVYERW